MEEKKFNEYDIEKHDVKIADLRERADELRNKVNDLRFITTLQGIAICLLALSKLLTLLFE